MFFLWNLFAIKKSGYLMNNGRRVEQIRELPDLFSGSSSHFKRKWLWNSFQRDQGRKDGPVNCNVSVFFSPALSIPFPVYDPTFWGIWSHKLSETPLHVHVDLGSFFLLFTNGSYYDNLERKIIARAHFLYLDLCWLISCVARNVGLGSLPRLCVTKNWKWKT